MKTQDKEPELDPFLCHCGPCKLFWKSTFPEKGNALFRPPLDRSAATSVIYETVRKKEDHPAIFKIGDRVLVHNTLTGVVKYVGTLDDNLVSPQCYVGVHLDEQVNSTHNGVYHGKRYFHCPRGHGAFVHYYEVVKINPYDKRPPVYGNPMYPAYREMLKQRRERSEMDPDMDWGPNIRRKEPRIHVSDADDIAIKDQKKAEQKIRRIKNTSSVETETVEDKKNQQEINKWKTHFGGDEKAEKMAATLQKLKIAYELGKMEDQQENECSEESFEGVSSNKRPMSRPRSRKPFMEKPRPAKR